MSAKELIGRSMSDQAREQIALLMELQAALERALGEWPSGHSITAKLLEIETIMADIQELQVRHYTGPEPVANRAYER